MRTFSIYGQNIIVIRHPYITDILRCRLATSIKISNRLIASFKSCLTVKTFLCFEYHVPCCRLFSQLASSLHRRTPACFPFCNKSGLFGHGVLCNKHHWQHFYVKKKRKMDSLQLQDLLDKQDRKIFKAHSLQNSALYNLQSNAEKEGYNLLLLSKSVKSSHKNVYRTL